MSYFKPFSMKNTTLKTGLSLSEVTDKGDLKQFFADLKDKNLIQAFESLPQNIAGEKGKVSLPCTVDCIDGVPTFAFMDFGVSYENEKLRKKSLATVKITLPFDGDNYRTSATFTSEEEAKHIAFAIAKNPSHTFECLVRRASAKKEGEDFFRHYVSIVVPKVVVSTTQQTTNPQAEQVV